MSTILTTNLTTGAVSIGDEPWTPRIFTFGESEKIAFNFVRTAEDGTVAAADLTITETQASVGLVDARPESGTFRLQIGEGSSTDANTTEAQQHDCKASELAAAINALTAVTDAFGAATVEEGDGSWYITFATATAATTLTLRENKMLPLSEAETGAITRSGAWENELRLTQLPPVFTDVGTRVLPPAPEVTSIQHGGSAGDGTGKYPEIQRLKIAPDFAGSYQLTLLGYVRTTALSRDDGADVIQGALEQSIGKGNVVVVLSDSFTFDITISGALAGISFEAMDVTVLDPPPGPLTLTLGFTTESLLRRLRAQPLVIVALEVRIVGTDENGDAFDRVVLRQALTVRRRLNRPSLATEADVDWLRAPSPTNYDSFSLDSVTTGYQFFPVLVGDGAATQFVIAHNLATAALSVEVWENADGGRVLINGTDYRVNKTAGNGTNSLKVTALLGTPASNAWYVVIWSNKTVSQFADGLTITADQVTGLSATLASLAGTVAAVAAQAATVPLGVPDQATAPIVVGVTAFADAFPGSATISGTSVDATTAETGWLLPALHTTSITSITSGGLPSIGTAAGNVYQNNTGGALRANGGGGALSSIVAVGDYVAGDGRRVYPVSKVSNSFFPRDFERQLFSFPINPQMLRPGTTLRASWLQTLQTLLATSRVKCEAVVEIGVVTSDTSPATTQDNLAAITWNTATPLLRQSMLIDANSVQHPLGFEIIRLPNGDLAANKIVYNFKSGADFVPATAKFECRGRLINFDTENSAAAASGLILSIFDAPSFQIQ